MADWTRDIASAIADPVQSLGDSINALNELQEVLLQAELQTIRPGRLATVASCDPTEHILGEHQRPSRSRTGTLLLGAVIGLMTAVPATLWFGGHFDPTLVVPATSTPVAAMETDRVEARMSLAHVRATPAKGANEVIEKTSKIPAEEFVNALAAEASGRLVGLLAEASRRVQAGDVTGAREILAGENGNGLALFALAETYDPNMLAAWGTRGAEADAVAARALYRKAFDLDVTAAKQRLESLQ